MDFDQNDTGDTWRKRGLLNNECNKKGSMGEGAGMRCTSFSFEIRVQTPSGVTTNTAYPDGALFLSLLKNLSSHFQGTLFAIALSYPA